MRAGTDIFSHLDLSFLPAHSGQPMDHQHERHRKAVELTASAARDKQPNRDRAAGNKYRVYTSRSAIRQLIGKGIPPARSAAIVKRDLAKLVATRGGPPAGGWELRDEDLAAMLARSTQAAVEVAIR